MIKPLAITLAVCLAASAATGGRIRNLATVRFRAIPLVLAALAVMVLAPLADLDGAPDRILVLAGYALAGAFLVVNLLSADRAVVRAGLAVLFAGWTLNAAVIAANGGMPLSVHAYERSGQQGAPTPGRDGFFKIVLEDEDTLLRPLGDVIPISPLRQVLSVGDIVLLAGAAVIVAGGMRPPTARP